MTAHHQQGTPVHAMLKYNSPLNILTVQKCIQSGIVTRILKLNLFPLKGFHKICLQTASYQFLRQRCEYFAETVYDVNRLT